ncbi:helix-turn-helix domain-containing protein [Solwaraspora sp. WMMB335]|uniref:helix-turn-helix domain-containing protein n=1 Tax=Solwaraspora sp. WMMB335 TaxID=3404118 RepID=UPI003B936715
MTHGAVANGASDRTTSRFLLDVAAASTLDELARLLRALRRRHARSLGHRVLSYRVLAAEAGWSHTAVAEYFAGKTLPPTDRFDVLVGLLGASPIERGALASARDRVDERRRAGPSTGAAGPTGVTGVTGMTGVTDAAGGVAGATSVGSAGSTAGAAGPPTPAGHPPAQDTGPVVPRQLPPAVNYFTGRRPELARLADLAGAAADGDPAAAARHRGPALAGVVRIVAVSGTAGVGKTHPEMWHTFFVAYSPV